MAKQRLAVPEVITVQVILTLSSHHNHARWVEWRKAAYDWMCWGIARSGSDALLSIVASGRRGGLGT